MPKTQVQVPVPPSVVRAVEAAGYEVAQHMPALLLPDHTVFTSANEGVCMLSFRGTRS